MSCSETHEIVIVGAGICGLATALALHRKGLKSLVLEKSNSLRAAGLAINIYNNGWLAFDQLGVGMELRQKAVLLSGTRDVMLAIGARRESPCGKEEFRCLKRSDLIETMANSLPVGSIRFGCHIVAVEEDPTTSFPILHLQDGSIVKTKVLIGCDGAYSAVAKSLGLKDLRPPSRGETRGYTYFPNGHNFDCVFQRIFSDFIVFGISPIDDKLVHWFVGRRWFPKDTELRRDPELLKDSTLEMLKGFPASAVQLVRDCDLDTLGHANIRYRAPWDLLFAAFWRGTVTVAGDAMHVMGPFLGQGGSAGVEDAIVLARNLAQELRPTEEDSVISDQQLRNRVGTAFEKYVRERKLRLLQMSTHTYLLGLMLEFSSKVVKKFFILIITLLFGNSPYNYTSYDCGQL